jgi:hypothetical protein
MNKWVSMGIDALSDFVIAAGTAYTALGGTQVPTKYQISICIVGGLMLAARGVKKTLTPPPP